MNKRHPVSINHLAVRRLLVVVDCAGVGLRTGELASTFKHCADDILQTISAIGVMEIDLLSFSLGGLFAQLVALNVNPKALKVQK